MDILFFQIEKYSVNKALNLFDILKLSEDDRIFSPGIEYEAVDDASRMYECVGLEDLLCGYARKGDYPVIVFEDNMWSRPLSLKVAMKLKADYFPAADTVEFSGYEKTVKRASFQSNILLGRKCEGIAVLTMNINDKEKKEDQDKREQYNNKLIKETLRIEPVLQEGEICGYKEDAGTLQNADVVFVCGSGVGSKENAQKVAHLAKITNAAMGATRPVVANGWLAPETLIGISGSIISPCTCVILGASGSQAFLAGVSGSDKIISVNNDRLAPIVKNSDIAVIGDCMDFVDMLLKEAEREKNIG